MTSLEAPPCSPSQVKKSKCSSAVAISSAEYWRSRKRRSWAGSVAGSWVRAGFIGPSLGWMCPARKSTSGVVTSWDGGPRGRELLHYLPLPEGTVRRLFKSCFGERGGVRGYQAPYRGIHFPSPRLSPRRHDWRGTTSTAGRGVFTCRHFCLRLISQIMMTLSPKKNPCRSWRHGLFGIAAGGKLS